MQANKIIIHYDEIATKGQNRKFFEQKLVDNLNTYFKRAGLFLRAKNNWGYLTVDLNANIDDQLLKDRLRIFPGVSHFGFALSMALDDEDALGNAAKYFAKYLSANKLSFRVSCKRSNKLFPKKSFEFEREFGAMVFNAAQELKVSLKDPDVNIQVEILNDEILIYEKIKGIAGLPIGSSGRAVALLSAGFDSPVASFLLQKRGVKIYPIHFHADDKTGKEPIEAVNDISKILSDIQNGMELALVNVLPIQKHITKNAPEKLRIVLLRRSFNRMASSYAKRVGALAIVTGESVGQVASQTLENILVSSKASEFPILRPLSGMNKNEIIEISRKIKTHDISARPCEDTCSLFVPKHPETKAKLEEVLTAEQSLQLDYLEKDAFNKIEIITHD